MEVGKQLTVRRADGSHKMLDPVALAASYDVGEQRSLAVAAGDRLLLQANARLGGQRFINGELVSVTSVQKETINLADGRVLPKNYRTFTHGYAVTSHAAQGKTVDEVLLVASSRSLAAVHQQQFYVSISRGRERCQVFTDDAERLRAHVGRANARTAAVEALPVPKHRLTTLRYLRSLVQRALRWSEAFRRGIGLVLQPEPDPGMKRIPELSQKPSIRPSHAHTL
jgi:ATP-dependent exoDNAse (exonuclease V) alpha subunit